MVSGSEPWIPSLNFVALAQLTLNTPVVRESSTARVREVVVKRRRVTGRDRAQIVELYNKGKSSRAVAQEVGVAKSTVLRVLGEAGVEMRPPHTTRP